MQRARKQQLLGNLENALAIYLDALDLNDEDVQLHCVICMIANELGLELPATMGEPMNLDS